MWIGLDLNVPDESLEWFETAVDCAAFLSYRLNLRGARVRFRTQEVSIAVPSEGTIYSVLRYLALVTPRAAAPLAPAPESGRIEIILTANPQPPAADGHPGSAVRVLDPSTLPHVPPAGGVVRNA